MSTARLEELFLNTWNMNTYPLATLARLHKLK